MKCKCFIPWLRRLGGLLFYKGAGLLDIRFGGVAVPAAASTWDFPKIRDPIGDDYMGFRVSGPDAWKLPHLDL